MADDTHCDKNTSTSPAESSDNSSGSCRGTNNVDAAAAVTVVDNRAKEIGGREGPDPTRYGDWEKNGRCIDF